MKLNDHRRKLLRRLYREQLDGEDDPIRLFRAVLGAVKASDHHMSKRAYQEPDSLFRNETRRERWVNEGRDRLGSGANGSRSNGGHPLMFTAAQIREREGI